MVNFLHIAGCKTDLVSIGRISAGSSTHQFLLGKFALQRICHRNGGIRCTCHTHCLIDIATAGKRITDGTTQTGSRTTERLDLRGMIVSFIFEEYQPLLGDRSSAVLVIHLHRNNDGAGVNLIGFLHIFQLAILFQLTHCHQGQIHQADKLILTPCKNLASGIQIAAIGGLNRITVVAIFKLYIF